MKTILMLMIGMSLYGNGMLIVEDYMGCDTCFISLKVVEIDGKEYYVNVEKGINIPKIDKVDSIKRNLEAMMKD